MKDPRLDRCVVVWRSSSASGVADKKPYLLPYALLVVHQLGI
jgi:hypothetical protein